MLRERRQHESFNRRSDEYHRQCREKGIGKVFLEVSEALKAAFPHGNPTFDQDVVIAPDGVEHALIWYLPNQQFVILVADDPVALGEGARWRAWYRRQLSPKQAKSLKGQVKTWLKNRANDRAQFTITTDAKSG